jgi:hypothetical protein
MQAQPKVWRVAVVPEIRRKSRRLLFKFENELKVLECLEDNNTVRISRFSFALRKDTP